MQAVLQYASNAFVINFYLSLIIDLLNTPRAMCFQKTVKVISRIIPWMTLINIAAIFPQCLLSTMENFKERGFILSDRWKDFQRKINYFFICTG